ncbi:MAG: hypothetical protein VKP72_05555 [bacterium]|nr:hypothetical protein [bacterium]
MSSAIHVIPDPAQLLAEARAAIVKSRYFQHGRTDRYGHVVGLREYPAGRVPTDHQVHHYDQAGRVILFEKYTRDFSKPTYRLYRYAGNVMNEAIWIDRYGHIEHHHCFQYDRVTGQMVWRAEYQPDGTLFYSVASTYDSVGNLIEDAYFDRNDVFVKREAYEHDKAGDVTRERFYDHENALVGFNTFTYDKQRRLTARIWHGPDGVRRSRFAYTYDRQDRLSRLTVYGPTDKNPLVQEFTYDDVGSVTRERWMEASGQVVKELVF